MTTANDTKSKQDRRNLLAEQLKKETALGLFQQIPGVGRAVAQDLWDLGLRSFDDLKNGDPEKLYNQLCDYQGIKVDRCMLYTFRCAVYYVSTAAPDPELLKWWNWADDKLDKHQNKITQDKIVNKTINEGIRRSRV